MTNTIINRRYQNIETYRTDEHYSTSSKEQVSVMQNKPFLLETRRFNVMQIYVWTIVCRLRLFQGQTHTFVKS